MGLKMLKLVVVSISGFFAADCDILLPALERH